MWPGWHGLEDSQHGLPHEHSMGVLRLAGSMALTRSRFRREGVELKLDIERRRQSQAETTSGCYRVSTMRTEGREGTWSVM